MKKHILCIGLLLMLLPALSACGKYDYSAHVSDERSDLFCAETEQFTLTVACLEREQPFLLDGVAGERTKTVEVTLAEKTLTGAEYEVYFLEDVPRGGDMSFRNVSGDYYYSRTVTEFPRDSVSLRIVCGETSQDIMATSVRNENTLTAADALEKAIQSEKETIGQLTYDGAFHGEFHVRLLRRDKNYYYVGIVDRQGGIISLLLDSETGEVLARREKR